ncbi:response regulator [Xylophilus rhododendri]|uniref:Response regulator n=1 Tax=Xylophilus rhododendri TaxID=2697032 RepID=A0A857J7K9_9BURK|nr:response regulator transcription factor [Xylophilus rhododendri]QHI99836.1 response regulator [Xylophilus rhododendri]
MSVLPHAIRVLIGDDHRIVREGIKQMLRDPSNGQPEIHVMAEAQTGPQVIDEVAARKGNEGLDVVLLDIALPERDGLDVLQQLRRDWPALPVLVISTYPENQYAVRCIRLGAAGYLNKSADPDAMVQAVRQAAAGGIYVTAAAAQALALAVGKGAAGEALSHREHQVFRLLTTGRTVSEIGAQLGLASNTVSTYRARILEKTGTKNDVELALYAERHGRDAVL